MVSLLLRGIVWTWNRKRYRNSSRTVDSGGRHSRRIDIHWRSNQNSGHSERLINSGQHIEIQITDNPPQYEDLTPPPLYEDINNLTLDYNNEAFIKTTPI
jgi:hypothetical protein